MRLATTKPGRYQANDDALLAEILDYLANDQSYVDEQVGSVDEAGWFARIGRFIVESDDQGFFCYMDHKTEALAETIFATIEANYPHSDESEALMDDLRATREEEGR